MSDSLRERALVIGQSSEVVPFPYQVDPEKLLRLVVANLAAQLARRRRWRGEPLWSRVGQLTGLGSTYAAALCRWAGYDPQTGRKLGEAVAP